MIFWRKYQFFSVVLYASTALITIVLLSKVTNYSIGDNTLSIDSIKKCYRRIVQLDSDGNREQVIREASLFRIYYIHKHEGLERLLQGVTVPTFKLKKMITE